ncbi:hypothetical protein MNBD_GAMMA07-2773 [hydrothermal vent metagenome]|uniref:Uncharacterized protein n=1 Tax=hydrothermal vent metagenome TaxID=652676 RepID=A0A3B0WK63_9ZZZZ
MGALQYQHYSYFHNITTDKEATGRLSQINYNPYSIIFDQSHL